MSSAFRFCFSLLALAVVVSPLGAEEWRYYGGDAGGSKYSSLKQINKATVGQLRPVWEFDTGEISDGEGSYPSRTAFECTPLVIDGVMYVTTPFHRLLALDPETGKKLWEFDPKFDRSTRVSLYINRGVAYWRSEKSGRIFLGDQQGRLYSVDTRTHEPDPMFGTNGMIDLRHGMADGFPQGRYGLTSPVAVCRDTVIAGSWVGDSEPRGPRGDVRGFDARSGKLRWTFHTVPRPGETGHDTWEGESWRDRGGTNVWSLMSVDEKLGYVYLPVTSPSVDSYGGDRKGANLFGDSVVALNCETGERKWHFQTIHHDLWDWDLPAQPVLTGVLRAGVRIPAVVQVTKTGFVFVFDRRNGNPLFEIEERPVPRSEIPGEASWLTQPFPVKPRPFARQSMTKDEFTNVSPESRHECLEMTKDAIVDGPMFRPVGEMLTVIFPGTNGGANWGGASVDPVSGALYVNSMDVGSYVQMVKRPAGVGVPYRNRATRYGRFWDSNEYPCQQPPWGSLTAIDLNNGEFRWRVPLGEFNELTRRGVPKTGTPNIGGSIVTAGGLVFIAATNDSRFRAFDKDTGEELWAARLPASGHATPMTYAGNRSGRQFVVIAAGGGNDYSRTYSGKLVAFAIGNTRELKTSSAATAPSRTEQAFAYKGKEEKLPQAVSRQPIPFSHKKHASSGIKCQRCHAGAATSDTAGLPTVSDCIECHQTVALDRQPVRELLNFSEGTRDVNWVRVYRLPDFVFFSHVVHGKAGIRCDKCHGPVQNRDVLAKEVTTSMTACVSCHGTRRVRTDCRTCHDLGR